MVRPSPGVPLNQAWGQKVRPVLNPHCLATLTRESGPVRTCNLIFHLSQQFALPPLQHKKKLGNFFRPARRIRKFLQGPENRRGKEPAQSGQPPRQAGAPASGIPRHSCLPEGAALRQRLKKRFPVLRLPPLGKDALYGIPDALLGTSHAEGPPTWRMKDFLGIDTQGVADSGIEVLHADSLLLGSARFAV